MKVTPVSLLPVLVTAGFVAAFTITERRSFATAAPIPDLVGTWTVQADGASLVNSSNPGSQASYESRFFVFTGEAIVQKQEGRRFVGILKSPSYTERFVGVIDVDGKTFAYADEDGSISGKIVSRDVINASYHHANAKERVVSSGTWIRRK